MPLSSILSIAKLLSKEFGKNFLPLARDDACLARKGEGIRENLSIISHQGEGLIRLINDVLDLNKMEPGLPTIVADPDRMQQLLINLINNAVKFTKRGSVLLRAFPRFGQFRVEVVDTGMGIHPEDQA